MPRLLPFFVLTFISSACARAVAPLVSDDAAPDAAPPGDACVIGVPLALTALTDMNRVAGLDDVAVDGDDVLVAISGESASGPPMVAPDPNWRVRSVHDDARSAGPLQVVLSFPAQLGEPGPSSNVSTGYVAARGGHRGFLAWDMMDGCRFVALDADGAPLSAPVSIGMAPCERLLATDSGFVTFELSARGDAPTALVTLDAMGNVLARSTGLIADTGAGAPWWVAPLADGSLMLLWASRSGGSYETDPVLVQHFSAAGDALSTAVTTLPLSELSYTGPTGIAISARLQFTSVGTSALVVWANVDDVTTVRSVAPDGTLGGTVTPPTPVSLNGFGDLDLQSSPDGALAMWDTQAPTTVPLSLGLEALSVQGSADGTPFFVQIGDPLSGIGYARLVESPNGALAVVMGVTGMLGSEQENVYAVRLTCAP